MLMYEDTVDVEFIEATHKYLVKRKIGDTWLEAKPTMGVTTYCGALAKDFLAPWAAKLAAEYAIDNAGTASKAVILDKAKNQHKEAANAGARAGKIGHAYVEAMLKGNKVKLPTNPDDLKVVESVRNAYDSFMADWKPKTVEIEALLYSKVYDYAGQADYICEIDGKLVVADWKTTNTSTYNPDGIYASYFAQLGAYSLAYEEMTGKEVKELYVVNLPKTGGEYKLKRLEDIGLTKHDAQAYFLTLRQAYELNKTFDWSLKK